MVVQAMALAASSVENLEAKSMTKTVETSTPAIMAPVS